MSASKKIVLADDDPDLLDVLAFRCRALNLDVRTARDGVTALKLITSDVPDVACIDVSMPGLEGLVLCDILRMDERFASLPLIVLTGKQASQVLRRCHRSCAYYVPKGADVWSRVEPVLMELLGLAAAADPWLQEPPRAEPESESDTPWVLCIEDDEDVSRALKMRLEAHGVAVVRASSGIQGYVSAHQYPADAILLDYNLPDGRGDYVLRRLKEDPLTASIPVIVVSGVKDRSIERQLRRMGAANYFTKPLAFDVLLVELLKYVDILPAATL
ncbi:MAG TPA: response regulator [Pirellulales bacterium]|nr:response regulator [Pirellulales bacterium]